MKTLLLIFGILSGWGLTASAQFSVEVVMDHKQYLANESMPASVKVTNRSGRPVHLGAEANWLTFSIESLEGDDVVKLSEVPVVGEFELESSQMATKHVDLQPYFEMPRSGRYKIVATVRIHDWSAEMASSPAYFDIVNGVSIWSQDVGLPAAEIATNQTPEMRHYSLLKVSYLTPAMKLYLQVSDPSSKRVLKVTEVGSLVSFSAPEAQVDQLSNLHVLFQNGASTFNYVVIDPTGHIFREELYDYVTSRPRLGVNGQGELTVEGGVRRLKSDEMPMVKMPDELRIPAPAPSQAQVTTKP